MKIVIRFVVLLSLVTFIFLNFGRWIDIAEKPIKADIIACLNGETFRRLTKSIELFENGYSLKKKILLTGGSKLNEQFITERYPQIPIVVDMKSVSTADEIQYIKQYMLEHHYKSVIIVSDRPHTRRIKILIDLISPNSDNSFSYFLVGSNQDWWNKNDKYHLHKKALLYTLAELIKIPYTWLYYGLVEKLGIRWSEADYKKIKTTIFEYI